MSVGDWPHHAFKFLLTTHFAGDWGADVGESDIDLPCVRVADFKRATSSLVEEIPTVRSYAGKTVERKHLKHNDLLVEKSGGGEKTPVGSVVLYQGDNNALCANFIEVMRLNSEQYPPFWAYVFRANFVDGATFRFVKQTTGIQNLDLQMFLDQVFAVPPLEQQRRIAEYLDTEASEMDAMVARLGKLIADLEERKKRFVKNEFQKVDEWDLIPQRLKLLVESEDGRRVPIDSGDRKDMQGEYPYYGASGVIDLVSDYIWDNEKRLLLSEDGANLVARNHPIAFVADGQYWVNNHAHVLKPRYGFPAELIAAAIEITPIFHLITGSAQPKLTAFNMGEISFLFPRTSEVAQRMLSVILEETAAIDGIIARSRTLIDDLKARRSALITEVVAGRKQV